MTLYWLSRNGDAPQGPLLLTQLRLMHGQGRISAEDFICAEGTEDWQPVASVFAPESRAADAVKPVARQPLPPHLRRGGWMPEDSVTDEARPLTKVLIVMALLACSSTVLYVVDRAHAHSRLRCRTSSPCSVTRCGTGRWSTTGIPPRNCWSWAIH